MRCKCVVETADGEFTRCAQMVHDPEQDYCYYHTKVVAGLTEPAEREYTDPERVVAYHKARGGKVRDFDKVTQ